MADLHPDVESPDMSETEDIVLDILHDDKECIPLISAVKKSLKIFNDTPEKVREPFATLSHRDAWINNFMVKFDNGKPVQNKLLDFQIFSYDSPVRDLLFFLNTSVQLDILKQNLDDFIKIYHDALIDTLKELKCPTEHFTFDKFTEEIPINAQNEIGHSLFFILFIVGGKKGGANEQNDPNKLPSLGTKNDTRQEAREKVWWITKEFYRRKWITI